MIEEEHQFCSLQITNNMESRLGRAEGVYGETWELQNLEFIHYLSEVMIELSIFGRNELELVKRLLKHADNLLRMDIFSPLQSHVITEIVACKWASAKVEIHCFVEKNSESEDGLPSILTNV